MADHLCLAVVPGEGRDEFAVEIHINGVEMTAKGAGLGMDPFDVLVPTNRFATGGPTTIPVARCGCGVYGCGMTDVNITRADGEVHWEWLKERPIRTPSVFDAHQYDAEVERVAGDFAWETPVRTAGRLVRTREDVRTALAANDLRIGWTGSHEGPFQVCLAYHHSHQILLRFEWAGRTPEALAALVTETLRDTPPTEWRAAWHSIQSDVAPTPPPFAGPAWEPWKF